LGVRWKYWIHHTWPEPRTQWAEAFVRPDDPNYTGESLWVTIDAAGHADAGDSDFVIDAPDFTQAEFLDGIKAWLRAKGLAASELVPARLEDFAGTHPHADFLIQLRSRTASE
jgi:hypothetical protein